MLRKYFSGTSAEVLLLLARAFYDAEQMPQARAALLRAVHLDPTNMQLRFNVALVLQVRPPAPQHHLRAQTPPLCMHLESRECSQLPSAGSCAAASGSSFKHNTSKPGVRREEVARLRIVGFLGL